MRPGGGDEYDEPEHMRKLFVGGLDYRTTDTTLKEFYEQWGEVVDFIVMKDPHTKRSRGFGFVTYSHAHMVDDAQNNRPHEIDGRVVEPKRAVPRDEIKRQDASATVKKLFVAGVKHDIQEEDLRDYFSNFGQVISVAIATERDTGKKKDFAFVEFEDYDPVDRACLQREHIIKGREVDVKKAMPKESGGGGRRGGGNWGNRGDWGNQGRGYNQGGGGGYNQGGGWGNQNPWDSGSPGGNWNNQGYGDQGGWGQQGDGFGGGYQQGYGGGPMRSNFSNNQRSQPYNSGGGGGYGSMGGGGGYSSMGGGGGGGGGGRRF